MALGDTLPQTLAVKVLETYIVASSTSSIPGSGRTSNGGDTDRALCQPKLVREAIMAGGDLRASLADASSFSAESSGTNQAQAAHRAARGPVREVQRGVERGHPGSGRRPRRRDRHFLHDGVPGPTAATSGCRRYGEDPRSARILRTVEQRYEKIAEDLIGDQAEPGLLRSAPRLMEENGFSHYLAGRPPSTSAGRCGTARTAASRRSSTSIPCSCCPGVVTASLFRRIQADFGMPIIDIFFDGTGNPTGSSSRTCII